MNGKVAMQSSPMKRIESHKDLIVWQKAIKLAGRVYTATRQLPSEERFGLNSQLRRAAVSIPSNIAEGAARRNRNEFLQFLHIARGSLSELETQMMIALEQKLVSPETTALEDIAEVGRLLNGLISKLRSSHREAHANACSPATLSRTAPFHSDLTANR
jgi:four helix bundle protein